MCTFLIIKSKQTNYIIDIYLDKTCFKLFAHYLYIYRDCQAQILG